MASITVLISLIARTHSNGNSITCSTGTFTKPIPHDNSHTVSTTCQDFTCTAKLVNGQSFKGFVVHSTSGTLSFATPSTGITKPGGTCLVHSNKHFKTEVKFTWSPTTLNYTSIYVTLVSAKPGSHQAGFKQINLAKKKKHVYIIGAGPGGLSAARWLQGHLDNIDFTVLERGNDPGPTWYTKPISDTASKDMTFDVMKSGASETQLASMVGGQQNINGAVYAPGTPYDLAKSIEVTPTQALYLQNEAGKYVHYQDHLMWKCIQEPDCDHGSLAVVNLKMARRSIAYGITFPVQTQADVQVVTNDTITFTNNTVIELAEDDCVILAAGALASPQLLGKTEFNGWNHYYSTDYLNSIVTKQTFEYPDLTNNGTEINIGNINNQMSLKITMDMLPNFREYHKVGVAYSNPHPESWAQAWHFAGTMNHTGFSVDGFSNIYAGDAGALKTPFNCHTSLPAAAAGIAAAHAALGIPIGELDFTDDGLGIKKQEISTEEIVITTLWFAPAALYLGLGLPWPHTKEPLKISVGRLVF